VLNSIISESAAHGLPQIHIHADDGRMLQFLLKAIGARRVIEVGTLAGYSGTWIARALPADGKLITLDSNPEHVKVAQESFKRAGVADRVEIRLGAALDSLKKLASDGPFDAIFIDANKDGYPAYLAWAIEHIRSGGLILAHNAFFGGSVVGAEEREPHLVEGLKAFNQTLAGDPRLFGTIIPIGDGLAAAVRL
jgi:caffeoyl-CoA O-methyltransferase